MTSARTARTIVDALRLDQWDADEVRSRVDRALEVGVGGFVLFGGEAESVARLTEGIRADSGRDVWIAADLERGAGQQFRGLDELPPPAALAMHADPIVATEYAAVTTGRQALSIGVNWVLAPVLDLDAERQNPIVATRSFGADPALVSQLGRAWIEACQGVGALACGKHFPGHGRTLADSHIQLPVVDASAVELNLDLAPFRAIADVSGSIMVAHVAYPAFGSSAAATVSPEVVTRLLRDDLGYRGLVATDAMIMGGVGDDDAVAAVDAIDAGCDVILYPSDVGRTAEALNRAANDRPGFAERVEEALGRSDDLLRQFPGVASTPDSEAYGPIDGAALAFARDAIVEVAAGIDAWSSAVPTEVVALADDPQIGPPAGRAGPLGDILATALSGASWVTRLRTVECDSGSALGAPDHAAQRIVVLAATPRGWKGHGGPSPEVVERVRTEFAECDRGLLVLLGHKRWLDEMGVPGICAWSTETIMERAAAAWIDERVGRRSGP